MNILKRIKARDVAQYLMILLGNSLYALSVAMFTKPAGIPLGGVSGVAMVLNYLFSLPMGAMILVLNIPLFLLSYKAMGRRFLIRTIFATIMSSVLIDFFSAHLSALTPTDNPLLICLYGGVLSGAGLGIVFAQGATTGGSDILAKFVHRKLEHVSIGRINLIINAVVIVISAAIFQRAEAALYAMVVLFVSSSVIDAILSGQDHASAAMIVTNHPEEVTKGIFTTMRRGCTGFPTKGMYTHAEQQTLLVAVRNHELAQLKRAVVSADPEAFVILLNAREVLGRGFKSYGQ